MRLVHGGSEGEGWHSHSEKGHSQSTSTPGLCHKHPESDINDTIPHVKSTRKSQVLDKKNEDYWQWDGKETLIRIHKTPRRQNFVPQDCEDCPCDPRIICDERETEQKFKTNTRVIKDTWRFKGDNHESTNKLNEFWTGKSTFKVLANAEVIDGDKNCKVSQGVITLCTHCGELNTIPITDVFVPYQYHIEVGKHEVDHPKVSVILWREKKNRTLEFEFSKSPCDLMTSKFAKFSLAINLIEVPRAVPCFVLLCSEERNWFTFLQNKMKDEMKFHVVPITEDDDMLSPYGISKARRCLRTKLDSVFFAGPCTGGSPWNRINRWVSEATTQLIEAKKQIFWAMWEVFASVLSELINMGSPALLELPRGCDYWKDRRMTDLVEGTVSHEHKFDGCMYGLKSQFQETPKPIKKPWKIVTWGVSFPKLHRRCDRRHDHVECAGRETRITQVYTKWIAKIIMNGINDHVIRNSPFVNVKVMKRWKSLAFDEQLKAEMSRDSENVRSHPIKSVATSVCATRELDAIDHSFEQSLLHWCLSRLISTSVLSSWHLSFSCRPLSEFDSDWLLRVLRSVQLFSLIELLSRDLRSVRLTSVQSEMAEANDMNSLGQFSSNRITIAQRVLKGSSEGTIAAKAPPPFRDTRGANHRLLSSEDIANQWIRFGMPPAVVYSAYFANTRYTSEATAEALEVAYKLLQRSQDTEKKCSGWEFISKGSRFVKVFTNRCPYEDATMGLFMDQEIYDRLDELWIVLSKGHFPEPFDDRISAAESEAKIRNMKQRFRGTPSFNTDPSATSWLAVTRTAEYFKVMDELTKVNPKSPSDNDSYLTAVKHMVEIQMRHLGHALRYHNEQNPSNQIILQDVMKDVIAFETNQPRGRSAAQNHFLCLLALGTTVERHKTSARGDRNLAKIAVLSEVQFSILKAFDIPQGILIGQGYNVSIADEGARYTEKERRHACHSSLKDFTTTMTETQGGTGGDMHNFDNWDVPLTFNDGRLPNEVDFWNNEEPSWIHDDTSTGPSAQSASSPPEGPQPQASQQPQGSTIQPKKMPRSSTGGGASSSTHAAFRFGPGTTPQDQAEPEKDENWTPTEDWMKRKKPSTVEVRLHAAEDYAHQEQRIAFLRSGRDFVLSTIEGPHTTHKYGTNLIWKQYLRRLTFHAALSFNMLTEGQLDSHMINESDYEWLKLYHHIITSTEFVRCKGYPVTEVLAMLTLGIEDTVEGEIRNKLKKLGSKIGQFIIGKPWMDRWDELGGQVRNNKSLILTDLTYQTRSSSRIVHDIEAGLNNMGLSSIKVYQLPYESLEKPEEFLKLATDALTFLRTNTATFTSVTIHIWISFASLFRGQNRTLVPNADFIVKLAGIITEISQEAPLPIFVNILKDARFLGSQSSIVSIAEEFARILKEKGIMHSTNERFWKQIYACGHEPFYWKEGEGKEVVWAMLEKSLMRQKVFLHCAMDHDTVHDLNEECVHVKNTGFDIETIKRCTEHPRIIPSIRTGDTKDAQTGSANIIGGMSHMKDSVQRRAWSDIRRGVFTPEPLTDVDEHWVEVTEDSELMCDVCKGFHQNDSRMSTCTENRTRCLNCASNWTRSAIYGTEAIGMDEFSQDARVAARLLNIYNECVDWRNMEAEKDLRGFLITATLAMLSGYKTTSDVLKQVSHRGAIRMPAYMVKGKCRRDLLPQFTVQRETRTEECGSGAHKIRWFYRLLWDGGNVAYHDYMKTVLTKEEIESMFHPTATAEYIGDIFEFWLGMLDLGIQFPTMFGGWGANLDSCLAGLEESFWLYSSSCRPTDTINTKRNRSRKAYIPLVENEMVTAVLREAGIFNLLLQKKITRMPILPAANYDDHPEMVEVSSSDEEMDEVDEPEEETTSPTARGPRAEQTSGETDAGGDDIEVEEDEEDVGGQPSEAKKRRTEVRNIRNQFEKLIADASNVQYCFICGGMHDIDECPTPDDENMRDTLWRMRLIMDQKSKSPSSSERSKAATRGRKDKLPKNIMPQGKRWRRTRFTEKEEVTKCFYSQPAFMYDIGDREEGGQFLVNGIEVNPSDQGVRSRHEIDALVERAAEESPPVLPTIEELNAWNPKDHDAYMDWLREERKQRGDNWNFKYIQPFTHGHNIGTLQLARINGEEYLGYGWSDVKRFGEHEWMGKKWENPQWMVELSKRFNAALRHSVGCVKDSRNHRGLPCDEAGWVNVEAILKYDNIWRDKHTLAGTTRVNYPVLVERWNNFQRVIFTEYKQTKRIRAQVLGLKVTKGELEYVMDNFDDGLTKRLERRTLRLEIGNADREIWLWPVAIRAPMAHSSVQGGVHIEDSKTSYQMNPGVGYTLGGGFHCTTFENIAQIFREGLRPGGGGDRINTFFVPFAPWDVRSQTVLRFKRIDQTDLVYIYVTYESIAKFSPRVSADGHILVQETIPFDSFDAMWCYDWKEEKYYRLMITKGKDQIVLSVQGAKKIATIERFDKLIGNIIPDESSPDLSELRKLVDIKTSHISHSHRLFPGHPDWNDAISLLAVTHRPSKEDHRLCPACLCETPASLSICVVCKGFLVSHGWRKRIKVTVATVPTAEPRPQEEDVKDHVKKAWEEVKIDLTGEEDDDEQMQDDDDVTMKSPEQEPHPKDENDDQASKKDDIDNERRDFREQDEVDEFLNEEREQAEENDDEETEGGEINIEEYEAGEAHDAVVEYPAWLKRVEFGSKVLPIEPCTIGDAQPELIKILLLQIGLHILRIYRIFQRNFCGSCETAWQHFQQNKKFRMDLDSKVPYLGEDENGELIEPTAQQMRELYHEVGRPDHKDDIGEEGFVNAYYGAIVLKRLVVYTPECGYTYEDLLNIFVDEDIEKLAKYDTSSDEMRKAANAREALDRQDTLVRRIIAGAYKVNAVYFFRNVDFQDTITLNPVDIVCALRPPLRRISVLHLILQNGRKLPRPLLQKLYDAIEDYNNIKQRDDQRPRWGIHMSEAHLIAIADTPVPADRERVTPVAGKSKAAPKAAPKLGSVAKAKASSTAPWRTVEAASPPKQAPVPPPQKGGKDQGKGGRSYSHRGGDWNHQGYYGWGYRR